MSFNLQINDLQKLEELKLDKPNQKENTIGKLTNQIDYNTGRKLTQKISMHEYSSTLFGITNGTLLIKMSPES